MEKSYYVCDIFRCLEYMNHLISLLEEHPEVELHDTLTDEEENYSVSRWNGVVMMYIDVHIYIGC